MMSEKSEIDEDSGRMTPNINKNLIFFLFFIMYKFGFTGMAQGFLGFSYDQARYEPTLYNLLNQPKMTFMAPPGISQFVPESLDYGKLGWYHPRPYYEEQIWTSEIAGNWVEEIMTTPARRVFYNHLDRDDQEWHEDRYALRDPSKMTGQICANLFPPVKASERPLFDYTLLWKSRVYSSRVNCNGVDIDTDYSERYRLFKLLDLVFPTNSVGEKQANIDLLIEFLSNYEVLTTMVQYSDGTLRQRIFDQEIYRGFWPIYNKLHQRNWLSFDKKLLESSPKKQKQTHVSTEETYKTRQVFDLVCFWLLQQPFSPTVEKDFYGRENCQVANTEYLSLYIPWSMIVHHMDKTMFELATKSWINPLQFIGFYYLLKYNFWNQKTNDPHLVMPWIGTMNCYSVIPITKNIFAVDIQSWVKRFDNEQSDMVDNFTPFENKIYAELLMQETVPELLIEVMK